MSNLKLLFTRSSSLNRKDKKKKRRVRSRFIGFSLTILQIIITMIFLALLFYINIVPNKYMIMLVVVLVLITVYNLTSQFTKAHIMGKILAALLSITLFTGSLYIAKATSMLDSISGSNTSTTTVSVVVLASDSASSLKDAKDYKFGYLSITDKLNSDKAISRINSDLGSTINTGTYTDWTSLSNALFGKNVKAILLNEAYRQTLVESFPDFNSTTKVIDKITWENQSTAKASNKNVNSESFTIYIAGNDQAGDIADVGRNDVNILATFNPKTKQVLLVTTPRDYYINIDNLAGDTGLDKLTHAGNFGVNGSITALSNLYGVDIDYYVKVNFTGAVGIVDALDGITVDSEVGFTTCSDTAPIRYTFKLGENECDGAKALAFCRERQVLAGGDNQRGRDQMIAIKAIIAKATSPAILTNYSAVLDSVSGMFVTNMPTSSITNLVKNTLSDTSNSWNVQTYNVTGVTDPSGKGSFRECQLFGGLRSVVLPDYTTVNLGTEMMGKIKNGDVFDVEEYASQAKAAEKAQTTTAATKKK